VSRGPAGDDVRMGAMRRLGEGVSFAFTLAAEAMAELAEPLRGDRRGDRSAVVSAACGCSVEVDGGPAEASMGIAWAWEVDEEGAVGAVCSARAEEADSAGASPPAVRTAMGVMRRRAGTAAAGAGTGSGGGVGRGGSGMFSDTKTWSKP
jgi:hypothetical protein